MLGIDSLHLRLIRTGYDSSFDTLLAELANVFLESWNIVVVHLTFIIIQALGDECLTVSKGAGKPCIIDLNQRLSFYFMLQAGYLRMELTTLSSPEY